MVIPYYVPAFSFGGPLTVCQALSKELTLQGHEVTIATTDVLTRKKRVNVSEEIIDDIHIIRFRNLSLSLIEKFNVYLPLGFKKWIKKNLPDYDLVHCHEFFDSMNVVVSANCQRLGIPYVIQPHGSSVPLRERGRSFPKKIFNRIWGLELMRRSSSVIAVTDIEKKLIRECFNINNVYVLPNAIEMTAKAASKSVFRKKYDIPQGSTVIISVGRLHKIKGFDLLINAFKIFHHKNLDSYLVIAGPDEGELENLQDQTKKLNLDKYVIFPGITVAKEKDQIYAGANIFAFLSRNEPFAMVVLEALQARLPVVISKEVGFAPNILKNDCGYVVDPYNTAQCYKAMEKSIKNSLRLSKNTVSCLKEFDIKLITKKLITLYNEILANY